MIVELADSDGLVGLGEAAPISRYGESVQSVAEFCQKIDPRRLSFEGIPASMAYLDSLEAGQQSAKCALNIALLDGAAKFARKPLARFLDLSFREKKYVTSFTIGIDEPAVIRDKVRAAKQYPVLKMKMGASGDRANLQALRDVAPAKPLRVDANEGWRTKEQALQNIEWLAGDGRVQFVEQPMPAATPRKDLVWLKKHSPLPIFADESFHTVEDAPLIAECFHGVNVKLTKSGGILAGREALKAARKAGLKTMLGCMIETSILASAAAHLAELTDYLDLDGNLLVTNDPYQGVTAKNGVLSFKNAPEKYGLRVKNKT